MYSIYFSLSVTGINLRFLIKIVVFRCSHPLNIYIVMSCLFYAFFVANCTINIECFRKIVCKQRLVCTFSSIRCLLSTLKQPVFVVCRCTLLQAHFTCCCYAVRVKWPHRSSSVKILPPTTLFLTYIYFQEWRFSSLSILSWF